MTTKQETQDAADADFWEAADDFTTAYNLRDSNRDAENEAADDVTKDALNRMIDALSRGGGWADVSTQWTIRRKRAK